MSSNTKAWKGVLIGGFPGIALGAAGAFFGAPLLAGETEGDNANDFDLSDKVMQSTEVNDDMSFAEAFQAARADVGTGGVFVWHGQVYSTFTSEEWAELSPEEQSQYVQELFGNSVVEDVDDNNGLEDTPPDDPYLGEQPSDEPSEEPSDEPSEEPVDVVGEPGQVDVLGSEVQIDEVGYYENQDGSQGITAVGTVDGHQAAFVDVDADGVVDGVMVDYDGDGSISENELIDMSESGLTIDDLSSQVDSGTTDPTDDIYAGGADYTNDADTSSLC